MQALLDEITVLTENGLSPPMQSREDMTDDQKQIATLRDRVTKIESTAIKSRQIEEITKQLNKLNTSLTQLTEIVKGQKDLSTKAYAIAGMWLAFLTVLLITATNRVSTLEGRGTVFAATVTAIDSAKSPDVLSANLELLKSQLRTAEVEKKRVPAGELSKIGLAVSDASYRYPELPGVWSTASYVATYRSERNQALSPDGKPDCLSKGVKHVEEKDKPLPPNNVWYDDQFMANCTLNLDDGPQFRESAFGRAYQQNVERGNVHLRFFLTNVTVGYSGGPLIPFETIHCDHCSFKMEATQAPPPAGRRILNQVMVADLNRLDFVGGQ